MSQIEQKLAKLELILPSPPLPAANYASYIVSSQFVFISGQLPLIDGKPGYIGKVGKEINTGVAYEAARTCALNVLSVLKEATKGNLDRVKKCIRLAGFVNATSEFTEHSQVTNGASDLIIEVMGEQGRHTRAAIGCGSLPFGVAVEVEAIFEIEP